MATESVYVEPPSTSGPTKAAATPNGDVQGRTAADESDISLYLPYTSSLSHFDRTLKVSS